MNLNKILLYLLILISFPASAQSYYPLREGNLWVYRDSSYDNSGYYEVDTSIVKVMGDTVLPNGKKYAVLNGQESVGAEFVREDSAGIYYYDSGYHEETLFYRFDLPLFTSYNVQFGPYFSVARQYEGQTSLFGKTTNHHQFYLDGLAVCNVVLGSDFGIIASQDLSDPPGWYTSERYLIGAIISDTVYGYIPTAVQEDYPPEFGFRLEQNYPNPFNPTTTITYKIPKLSFVSLKVYDVLGREVAALVGEEQPAGRYTVNFDAPNLASGIYIYQLRVNDYISSRKMLLLR